MVNVKRNESRFTIALSIKERLLALGLPLGSLILLHTIIPVFIYPFTKLPNYPLLLAAFNVTPLVSRFAA